MRTLVVASRRYNGHELWVALGVMQRNGIGFEVVSSSLLIEDEKTKRKNRVGRTQDEIDPNELGTVFDSLMIVSGHPKDTESNWTDRGVQSLVLRAKELNLPVGAICMAVPTIRFAATGRRVSAFPTLKCRDLLKRAGVLHQTVAVTVDGNIVTAEHQMATQLWAEMWVKVLRGEEADPKLVDSGFIPKGRPRKPIPELERVKKRLSQGKV
jgi:putative intracellular protease/amidase